MTKQDNHIFHYTCMYRLTHTHTHTSYLFLEKAKEYVEMLAIILNAVCMCDVYLFLCTFLFLLL